MEEMEMSETVAKTRARLVEFYHNQEPNYIPLVDQFLAGLTKTQMQLLSADIAEISRFSRDQFVGTGTAVY